MAGEIDPLRKDVRRQSPIFNTFMNFMVIMGVSSYHG